MSRVERLVSEAYSQVAELKRLIGVAGEEDLGRPCRAKLGDGTVAACATHTARNYERIAGYVERLGDPSSNERHGGHGPGGEAAEDRARLLARLERAGESLSVLGELEEAALSSVPAADGMRFADGRRTLQEILEALLKHQRHQVSAVRDALA